MDTGGQLSADFLFATLILILIVGVLSNIVSSGMDTANNAEFSKAKVLADSVSRAINTVYTNGYGQYLVFEAPNPNDFNYTAIIDDNGVAVSFKGKTASSSIIPKGHIDPFTISPGNTYNITNTNGQIKFAKIT